MQAQDKQGPVCAERGGGYRGAPSPPVEQGTKNLPASVPDYMAAHRSDTSS